MATTTANRKDETVTTATREVQVLKTASAVVMREPLGDGSTAFSVRATDFYVGRDVVFNATSQQHALRLAEAINECKAWAIE